MTDEEFRKMFEGFDTKANSSFYDDILNGGSYFDRFGKRKEPPPKKRQMVYGGELVQDTDGVYRVKDGSQKEPF